MITRHKISFILLLGCLSACAYMPKMGGGKVSYEPVAFSSLKGWKQGNQKEALVAMQISCLTMEKKNRVWLHLCEDIHKMASGKAHIKSEQVQRFLETYFTAYALDGGEQEEGRAYKDGLFTGYYEPLLRGSYVQQGVYQTPLWGRPDDLVTLDLGLFREEYKGKRLAGRVENGALVPYADRSSVSQGRWNKAKVKPIFFVDDPIDAFFLEVQGSGRIQLPDGKMVGVGYAAQNGHLYTAIGRILLNKGEITEPVSLDKIRAWLGAHPSQAQTIMNNNASVVFFRETGESAPMGAMGLPLTPDVSLAVDPLFTPLGAPVWLETTSDHRARLMVAQDTGGAIKGPVRGDIFYGFGKEAENKAGTMQSDGRLYILWPKGEKLPTAQDRIR